MDISTPRFQIYPEIQPHDSGMIDLDGHHKMYWEVSGNPEGVVALFLHGGPGAGSSSVHRRFFDPGHYRIVVFDQRGAGRSRPFADIEDNTTDHLIADMEVLRDRLNIENWLLFGGSWGSSLALAYAIRHPERVTGFVLRGVFLCRRQELDWFLGGIAKIFPENWRQFSEFLPADERADLLANYHARLIDEDPSVHGPAARAWTRFEASCSTLLPGPQSSKSKDTGRIALALARIEAHYFINHMFLPEDHLLRNLARVNDKPAVIVQGRYDMICPVSTADELSAAWPQADFVIVPDAGHSAMEPSIRSALVEATEKFKDLS